MAFGIFLTNDCLTVLSRSRAEHQTRLGGEKRGALCEGKKNILFSFGITLQNTLFVGHKADAVQTNLGMSKHHKRRLCKIRQKQLLKRAKGWLEINKKRLRMHNKNHFEI